MRCLTESYAACVLPQQDQSVPPSAAGGFTVSQCAAMRGIQGKDGMLGPSQPHSGARRVNASLEHRDMV